MRVGDRSRRAARSRWGSGLRRGCGQLVRQGFKITDDTVGSWYSMGAGRFPAAARLLVTADAGGSNGHRVRLWNFYQTGTKVSAAEPAAVPLTAHEFHGAWNYTIARSNSR